MQKNSSWLYIQTGLYITMGLYNIDNKTRYLSTFLLVLFLSKKVEIFWGNGQGFISKKQKRFGSQNNSVSFKMIRKMTLLGNLESQCNRDI